MLFQTAVAEPAIATRQVVSMKAELLDIQRSKCANLFSSNRLPRSFFQIPFLLTLFVALRFSQVFVSSSTVFPLNFNSFQL